MSKKHKHHFHFPASSGPRLRWELPDDLREVKLAAFAQGIINATEQKRQALELTPDARMAGSIDAAIMIEQEKRGGRQGTNDGPLFRQTFANLCALIWEAVYSYWEEAPEVYESFVCRPPQQQGSNALSMAEQYLDAVEQKIAAGEPVEFTW